MTFVERDAAAARELSARLTEWGATSARVEHSDALRFLGMAGTPVAGPFTIVFLDPPFESDLLVRTADLLETGGLLAPSALIYVECAARSGLPALPSNWSTTKAKQAGEVGYHLLTRD